MKANKPEFKVIYTGPDASADAFFCSASHERDSFLIDDQPESGFRTIEEAEQFLNQFSVPAWVVKTEIHNGYGVEKTFNHS